MNVTASAAASSPAWDPVADLNRASALLHPLRLRILDALREPAALKQKWNRTVGRLAAHFPVSAAAGNASLPA